MDIFDLNLKEIIQLRRWYKRQPKKFRRAEIMVLNEFAFGNRRSVVDLLTKRMTIRNPKFLNSRIKVSKATMSRAVSVMGTIESPRFSGFVEQEFGTATDRNRVASLLARGGSASKQIKPSLRLKPSADIITKDDYGIERNASFLAAATARKEKKMIRIGKSILKRRGGKFRLVQRINPKNKQPKRRPFMQTSRKIYFSSINLKRVWADKINRVLTPPKR